MRTHDEFMRDLANNSAAASDYDMTSTSDYNHNMGLDEADSRRKKTRTVHPSQAICRDWMIVSGNCHYARDAASFTTYKPVNTLIKSNIFSPHDETQVAGVGTVCLEIPRGRNDPRTHTLVLEGVLHIPGALCNGFNPLLVGSSMSCHADFWEGADRLGQPMWFGLPFAGMGRLVLAGGAMGESDLIPGREYTLSLYISPEERRVIMEA
ncbi:hypothetical protein BJX64DRAFT_249181 [Aspergillus heterothallicus]